MIAQPVPLNTSPTISKVPEPMRSTMKPAGVCKVADKKPETAMAKPSSAKLTPYSVRAKMNSGGSMMT